jgi:hypothetical protein
MAEPDAIFDPGDVTIDPTSIMAMARPTTLIVLRQSGEASMTFLLP